MEYRVDQLAARAGTSVDTVRFYQTRNLLPPPARQGRIAWYSDEHLTRLKRIRELKDAGFTLESIRRLLDGEVDAADAALASAVQLGAAAEDADEFLTLDDLAAATGVSPAVLAAIEREGLLVAQLRDGRPVYTAADVTAVGAGLELLQAGLPLSELLGLARRHDDAMHEVAEQAVEMFARFVRDPIMASAASDDEAASRLVDAFHRMLPATTSLVAHHFRRVLLTAAQKRMEKEGLGPQFDLTRSPMPEGP
jgi:DNA-binding transcriptional MerR regulator